METPTQVGREKLIPSPQSGRLTASRSTKIQPTMCQVWECSTKVTNTSGQGAQGTEDSTLITNTSRQSAQLQHTTNGAPGIEMLSTSNNYHEAKCTHRYMYTVPYFLCYKPVSNEQWSLINTWLKPTVYVINVGSLINYTISMKQ